MCTCNTYVYELSENFDHFDHKQIHSETPGKGVIYRIMILINVYRDDIDKAIKSLEKKFAGVRKEIKDRERYVKPSDKKRFKRRQAARKKKKWELKCEREKFHR